MKLTESYKTAHMIKSNHFLAGQIMFCPAALYVIQKMRNTVSSAVLPLTHC